MGTGEVGGGREGGRERVAVVSPWIFEIGRSACVGWWERMGSDGCWLEERREWTVGMYAS